MSRLAEYFAVVGIDKDSGLGNEFKGKVLQRFPAADRKDVAFPEGIELFCQPGGWKTSHYSKPHTFFVAVLTDVDGDHRYCACFTFFEPYVPHQRNVTGTQSLSDSSSVRTIPDGATPGIAVNNEEISLEVYAPKCLCLVSRVTYFDVLKNCLKTIYLSFLSGNNTLLEKLVGSILGFVKVPPPGGPKLTFSIGAGDRQTLCPPVSETIPVTHKSVSMLFQQIGIQNMLSLFCAAVTENKILFISSSYFLLTNATRAMLALMYPLKFSYVYIPILPAALLDFLSAPTPFIMGVHDSYKDNIPDLSDVILVDVDGGHVSIPDSVHLAELPEPFMGATRRELNLIMNPQLVNADYVFQPPVSPSPPPLQDKEIRAIFIRLLSRIFTGYRSCLTLIRIHPKPVITFNKTRFLEQRGMMGDEFLSKLLESISYSSFIAIRGPPYRSCDLFDQMCSEIDEVISSESDVDADIVANIQHIAGKLFENEPLSDQSENQIQSTLSEADKENSRKLLFPHLDATIINQFIKEEAANVEHFQVNEPDQQIVPCGSTAYSRQQHYMYIHTRKLEVLKDCVAYIFDNKISEARMTLPSIVRSLKSKGAQMSLCHELSLRAKQNRSVLEHDQFDLIVKLMNSALQDDASMDNTQVAAALLPLAATFCRKLATGCIQFAYTCVQDHPIWEKQQFWEEAFYMDVQTQIKQLYIVDEAPRANEEDSLEKPMENRSSRSSLTPSMKHRSFSQKEGAGKDASDSEDRDSKSSLKNFSRSPSSKPQPSALDIAAEQLKCWPTMPQTERDTLISSEESIVYSQAIHYANRMVYMRIPLNACTLMHARKPNSRGMALLQARSLAGREGSVSGVYTTDGGTINGGDSSNSVAESGWDSYLDDDEETIADNVTKFVTRFVDRVGTEAGIRTEHMKSLYAMIPGVVAMHIESLEPVWAQYRRLAPQRKIKIMRPALLKGEEMLCDGLRCYLLADGRELGRCGEAGGLCLIPAEGAVFLTNYRVIFKVTPVDQYASEMIVTRSFPVGSTVREKKINVTYMEHLEQWLHDCIQLRSSTFQMMKLAYDEEVGTETVEMFRKRLHAIQGPPTVFSSFAFVGKGLAKTETLVIRKQMDRQGTLRKTRKRFQDMTSNSKRAGLPHLKSSTRRKKYKVDGSGSSAGSPSGSLTGDESGIDVNDIPVKIGYTSIQGVDKLNSSPCCLDYSRLGFGNVSRGPRGGPWRISMVNYTYTVCRSYPSVLVVPQSISDDTILRVAKNHRQGRFPVAVWKHSKNKATLLRAGGIERSSMASMIRSGISSGSSGQSIPSSSLEQEKLFGAVVSATPLSKSKSVARANSLHHGVILNPLISSNAADELDAGQLVDHTLKRKGWEPAALYVLGDKHHLRNIKQDSYNKVEFVPVELPDVRAVRACFKKFQRACCPSQDMQESFHKQIDESEWLHQLSAVLNVSNALVDLIDIQGSSVMVCFEDGWDVTSQVVALAEICLDPYYRTIEGFKILVEKEWLSFGHRFLHRCNQVAAAQRQNSFTPIFLQFLDAVHQIMLQFPHSFEFNNHFLSNIAYHHVSKRFRTFLLDSEHERYEAGWMTEDADTKTGKSLWDYIEAQNRKGPAFSNFLYALGHHKVLRPFCKISNLKVWNYYITENLSTGPPYDAELINEVETTVEDQQSPQHKHDYIRRCMTGCYGDVTQFSRNECTWLLQEVSRLEEEADHVPNEWEHTWKGLEYPPPRRILHSNNHLWYKQQALMQHKRSTMEVVLRGKMQVEDKGAQGFSQPHNFNKHTFLTPTNCDYCLQMIIGFVSKALKCTECGYNVHEKCQSQVPWQCKKRDLSEQPGTTLAKSTISLPELRYYDTKEDAHCAGYIDLGEMTAVMHGNSAPGAPKGADKSAFFDLRTTKRLYSLLAENKESSVLWIEKLQSMNV